MRKNAFLFTLALLLIFVVGTVHAQEVTLNLAAPDPQTSPITMASEHLSDLVKEKTDGEVEIKVFADGVLFGGSPSNAVNQLSDGSIDILTLSTSLYASFEPKYTAISVPYMFEDLDQLESYLAGEPGQELSTSLKKQLGIETIGYWTRPPRHLTNSKRPVDEAADFEGLKLRVPNSPLWVEFFGALGANPTPMSFSEVYNALQLNTIDGQENPLGVPVSAKFYEVQDYLTLTGHILDAWVVGFNEEKWNSLSDEHKAAIQEAVEETRVWKREFDSSNREEYIQILKDNGMEVIELTDENLEEIREIARSVYPEFEKIVGEEFFQKTIDFVE